MQRPTPGSEKPITRRAMLGTTAGALALGVAHPSGLRKLVAAQEDGAPAATPQASPEATPVLVDVATPDPGSVTTPEATPMTVESGGNWPMGSGGPGRRSFSPEPGPGEEIELLWMGLVGDYGTTSPPVISNGVIYVCGPDAGGADFYPSSMTVDTVLAAMDLHTGRELWSIGVDVHVGTLAPVISHDAIYLIGTRGGIRVIDVHSRQMRWEATLPTEVLASPVIVDDILYINGADSTLYALDARDGSEVWTFGYDAGAGDPTAADPVVGNGMVYLPSGSDLNRTSLFALDAQTGEERWRVRTGGEANRFAALDGNDLFLFGNQVHAIDALSAETRWVARDASASTRPVVADEAIYTLSRARDTISCLDRTSGEIQWTDNVRELSGPMVGSEHGLVVSQELEFSNGPRSGIHAFGSNEGGNRWFIPGERVENQVAIAGDIMVVTTGWSDVVAFRTIRADNDGSDGSGRIDDIAYLSPLRFSSDKVEDDDHFVESGGFLPESTSTITVAGTLIMASQPVFTWDVVWLLNGRSMMRTSDSLDPGDDGWAFSWELDRSAMEGFRDEISVEIRIDGRLLRRGRVTLYDRGFRDQDNR